MSVVFSEFLQPYRERPQTSKLLADKLVTGALGMRSKMTREERVKEREKLKEAKSETELALSIIHYLVRAVFGELRKLRMLDHTTQT